jgi:hypothetical protein
VTKDGATQTVGKQIWCDRPVAFRNKHSFTVAGGTAVVLKAGQTGDRRTLEQALKFSARLNDHNTRLWILQTTFFNSERLL